jgi:hypothetical protein
VDPADLRERADQMPREEILDRYARAKSTEEIVEVYRPLVQDLDADVVTIQMASLDQPALIQMLGREVLTALKS